VFQVDDHQHQKQAAVKSGNGKLSAQAVVPVKEGKHQPRPQLYPQDAPGNRSPAVAAAAPQPEIAEDGDEVSYRKAMPAGVAMGWWIDERLSRRQAVTADIEETADSDTE